MTPATDDVRRDEVSHELWRKALLACGIASSLLYGSMIGSTEHTEDSMKTRFAFVVMVAAVLVTGLVRLGTASAPQNPSPQPPAQQAQNLPDMMKMHEKMMADMKAADARLDALVKAMNAAAGDAKTNAIAAVVNELVAQHKLMHAHMGQMHQEMMGGRGMMMKR